uniref:Uncharacterized protein n=1 Tax=viral metagenome TaxID=1070528 RepID=A0A6C0HRT4_9ZZZZ
MSLFFQKYKLNISILLFLVLFSATQYLKPPFLYDVDGSLKQFGMGYTHKTIFPVWLFAIYLGILSYVFVLILAKYYL